MPAMPPSTTEPLPSIDPRAFDPDTFATSFEASVVDAYRRGVAEAELPSDAAVARSVIPPGTAATRDFSGLAPRIPQFMAERCVGCMACVSACPDNALLATVQPAASL